MTVVGPGRIVLTRLALGEDPVPAIICRVIDGDRVDLCAFNPYPMPLYGVTVCDTEEQASEPRFIGQYRAWWPPRVEEFIFPPARRVVEDEDDVLVLALASMPGVLEVVECYTGEPTMVRPQGHPTIELTFTKDADQDQRIAAVEAAYRIYPDHRLVVTGGMTLLEASVGRVH